MSPLSCLSGVALPVQVVGVPPPWSLGGALGPGVAGSVPLAQRTRRRRRIGSSNSSKRQRGLGVPPPCHPDVPLSPGLPMGWADSDSVRGRGALMGPPAASPSPPSPLAVPSHPALRGLLAHNPQPCPLQDPTSKLPLGTPQLSPLHRPCTRRGGSVGPAPRAAVEAPTGSTEEERPPVTAPPRPPRASPCHSFPRPCPS